MSTDRHPTIRQIYLIGAVLAFAASFAPLWTPAEDAPESTDIGTYSLWTVIPADGGGAALLGVLLILALVGLAVAASAAPDLGRGVPVAVFVMAVVALLMLIGKPNTGTPTPHLGPGGGLLFGTTLALGLTAVVDLFASFSTKPARRVGA